MAFKDFVEGVVSKMVKDHLTLCEPQVQELVHLVIKEQFDASTAANDAIVAELEDVDIADITAAAIDVAHPGLEDEVTDLFNEKVQTMIDELVESVDFEQLLREAVENKLARALEAIRSS